MTRDKFLKIFNLFVVLSYVTVFKRIHKGYATPLGNTPGCDYTKLPEINQSGIDFDTLENDSFP